MAVFLGKRTPEYGDKPAPYKPVNTSLITSQQTQTLVVDDKSNVFHDGARFNEFAKPVIPPPPPGCYPNQYQKMQTDRGQFTVVLNDTHASRPTNKYGTF